MRKRHEELQEKVYKAFVKSDTPLDVNELYAMFMDKTAHTTDVADSILNLMDDGFISWTDEKIPMRRKLRLNQ